MSSKKVIICVDDEKIILTSLKTQLVRTLGKEYALEFTDSALEAIDIIDDITFINAPLSDILEKVCALLYPQSLSFCPCTLLNICCCGRLLKQRAHGLLVL